MNNEEKKKKMPEFLYTMKLKTALIGFVSYLLLTNNYAFQFLNTIFNNWILLLNDKNEPTILAKIIMASIIAVILFIF
jgi:hypothetical protein